MKFKLKASFETGSAANCPVIDGICLVDTQAQVDDLCQPPHNFKFIEMFDDQTAAKEEEAIEAEEQANDAQIMTDEQEIQRLQAENEALKRRGGKKGGR